MCSSARGLIRVVSVIGVIMALYALYIEYRVSLDPEYKALCDITPGAKCSRVLTSPSSHLFFGIPNAALGVCYYIAAFLSTYPAFDAFPAKKQLLFTAATFSCVMSAYLATILYAMRDICLVCITTYICNAFIWFAALRLMRKRAPKQQQN